MIRKQRDFDTLAKAAKTAGLIAVGEIADIGTSVALGTVKTMQESTWEKKMLLGGIIGNIAAKALDMDLPFAGVGLNSMVGIDGFVDNASDIAMGIAGTSLAYKAANNIQSIHNSNKTVEDIMEELGIEVEISEPVIEQSKLKAKGIFAALTEEQLKQLEEARKIKIKEKEEEEEKLDEEQEMSLLKQLLAKYGNKLNTEEKL